jgi:hypothetical protein
MAGSGDEFFTVVYELTILCSYARKEGTDGHKDRRFYLHFDILVPSPASKKAENKKSI